MGRVPHGLNTRNKCVTEGQLLSVTRKQTTIGTSYHADKGESKDGFPGCDQAASHASPRAIVNALALSARVTLPAPSAAFNAALFAARIA